MVKNKNYVYKKGYLPVGDGHEIYYELYGNPKGKPILFFHGGPAGSFTIKHKNFFDPSIHSVIFFDQRGAGKSKPTSSTKNNTTQDLISDSKKLLDFVGVKNVFLYGGSWGSTMALLFAIKYPEMVNGIFLRGVFLGTKAEIVDSYIEGNCVKIFYPEVWERFISLVPENERKNVIEFYFKKMNSDDKKEKEKYLYEWAFYEDSIMSLNLDIKKVEKEYKEDPFYREYSLLNAYYMLNNCFLEDDFILKNINKIPNVPISIIQGRYDTICPPTWAIKLHKKLKGSKLFLVTAGHSSSDLQIKKKSKEELKKLIK